MDNWPSILVMLLGVVVGSMITIVVLALVRSDKTTENLCPRCKNETAEERQLKQDWAEQQKGYNN